MKRNKTGSIISGILFVLIIALAVGLILRYKNGFHDLGRIGPNDNPAFGVELDGEALSDSSVITLERNEATRFDVTQKGFRVKVVQCVSNISDFEFTVNDLVYLFSMEPDFTAAFDIELFDTYFTVTSTKDMRQILLELYPGSAVTIPDINYADEVCFALILTSADGAKTVTIPFLCNFNTTPTNIVLDKEELLFL